MLEAVGRRTEADLPDHGQRPAEDPRRGGAAARAVRSRRRRGARRLRDAGRRGGSGLQRARPLRFRRPARRRRRRRCLEGGGREGRRDLPEGAGPRHDARARRRGPAGRLDAREGVREDGRRARLRRPEAARAADVGRGDVRASERPRRRRGLPAARRPRRRRRGRARERGRQARDVGRRRRDRGARGRARGRTPRRDGGVGRHRCLGAPRPVRRARGDGVALRDLGEGATGRGCPHLGLPRGPGPACAHGEAARRGGDLAREGARRARPAQQFPAKKIYEQVRNFRPRSSRPPSCASRSSTGR